MPGIDSDNAFCRGWSEYAGSVQALSLAWAVQPAEAAATLEVAASDAVSDAVAAMAAALPAEIESNRERLDRGCRPDRSSGGPIEPVRHWLTQAQPSGDRGGW